MDPIEVVRKQLKIIAAVVLILLLGWLGYLIYLSTTFHATDTNPSLSSVATVTPFLEINFNRPLSSSGVNVTSSPSIINSYSVSGDQLKLNFPPMLQQNRAYTVTVESISDTTGKQLKNLHFTFTPKYISTGNLPEDQQQAILKRQAAAAPQSAGATFAGTEGLINNGLTTTQVQVFESDLMSFSQANKLNLNTVVVNTVNPGPLNGSGTFTLNFVVSINSTNYNATITYSGITTIELTLTNSQGVQVYNAGSPS